MGNYYSTSPRAQVIGLYVDDIRTLGNETCLEDVHIDAEGRGAVKANSA